MRALLILVAVFYVKCDKLIRYSVELIFPSGQWSGLHITSDAILKTCAVTVHMGQMYVSSPFPVEEWVSCGLI